MLRVGTLTETAMRSGTLLLLLLVAWSPVAAQQLSPDWTRCANRTAALSLNLQIAGCTAVLRSRRETTSNRAVAYSNRGVAHSGKKDYDRAIADYNEALRLDPTYAVA